MEQIIPILIAVLVFAFQAYSNYQKEQEKARKRKYGQPIPDDTIPVEGPGEIKMDRPVRPSRTTAESRPATRQPEYTPFEVPASPYHQYQGMLEPEEVKRARQNRTSASGQTRGSSRSVTNKHSDLIKKVELTDLDTDHTGPSKFLQQRIDLREAVIHSIILERPAY